MGRDRTRLERLENLSGLAGPVTSVSGTPGEIDVTAGTTPVVSLSATFKTAGGDLSGTYPNPTVTQVNAVPFNNAIVTAGNILIADGAGWNSLPTTGDWTIDGGGFSTVVAILNNPLGDTTIADGSILIGHSGLGSWNSQVVSGDATLSRTGVLTVDPRFISDSTSAGGDLTGGYPDPTIISSVTLTGNPQVSTQAKLTNNFTIADTAYVNAEINAIGQYFAPATGATVSPTAPQMFQNVFINPAAGIATLTLTLPTGTLQGQVMYVAFTQVVTALTVTATNIGTHGIASPTTAIATSSFAWAWDNTAAKWNRFL